LQGFFIREPPLLVLAMTGTTTTRAVEQMGGKRQEMKGFLLLKKKGERCVPFTLAEEAENEEPHS
jgi:hypothetical protein